MGRALALAEMLRQASPTTRREFIKLASGAGISAPALIALLAGDGVSPIYAAPARQDGEPQQGGTLVLMGHQEIASLSPDDMGPSVHFVMVTQIHNGLVELDENFQVQPVLAEALPEISEDNLTYTFTLRPGVTFHDGTELTSEDVKYTYEWYMNPDNAAVNANYFTGVESVEAPDPLTVVVTLKAPNASFYGQVGDTFIVPAAYHAEIGEDAYKGAPIGTGPFRLAEWNAAEFTLVEAFDEHFRGRPHLDAVRMNIVPEPSVRAIGLETGEADSSVWPLLTEDSQRLAEDTAQFTAFVTSALAVNHFPLNNTHPILSDKRVRQAMMHAIDRQAIIDDVFRGAATLALANLSPALADHYNAEVKQYEFDPERAAALLDEAGWTLNGEFREKDGERLSFVCTTITGDQARRPEAEIVQQNLADVGIEMQLEEAPVATILEQLRSGEMDASLFNWTYGGEDGDPDASTVLRSDGTNNFSHFENARVDELLDLGLRETDPANRAEYYKEIQEIVAEEVPFLFMMFWDLYNLFRNRVQGLPESALNGDAIYAKAYQFWIEE
ncbi:MAG: ABC transporter substrate-binding protein [Thermomicrobiales bacterium]